MLLEELADRLSFVGGEMVEDDRRWPCSVRDGAASDPLLAKPMHGVFADAQHRNSQRAYKH